MKQYFNNITFGAISVLAVIAIALMVYYLHDVNHALLQKIWADNDKKTVGEGSFYIHSWAFALVTMVIIMKFEWPKTNLHGVTISIIFAMADGIANVFLLSEGILRTGEFTYYDKAALFYGLYVAIIMFFGGITVHSIIAKMKPVTEPVTVPMTTAVETELTRLGMNSALNKLQRSYKAQPTEQKNAAIAKLNVLIAGYSEPEIDNEALADHILKTEIAPQKLTISGK